MRPGDVLFQGIALVAALGATVILGLLIYKVLAQAWPAMRHFGIDFVWSNVWNPNSNLYGAASFIFGTIITSFIALLIATPLAIAIALFLTEISPKRLAAPIATVVELLAAIPSVVLGLWGILVFGPWLRDNLEPWLQGAFGWLPIFSGPTSQVGVLPAALILTIMIVPIISALCRELFSRIPRDLTDGSLALGSTKWEAIRRVGLPYVAPRHRRRDAARARPCVRRGDRGDAGDRWADRDPQVAVRSRGHAREQNRVPVPGRDLRAPDRLAALPRRDPDGDLAGHESRRAVGRRAVREGEEASIDHPGRSVLGATSPPARAASAAGERVEKGIAVLAILSALLACAILFIVLGSVLLKGVSQLDLSFFTKPKPLFGEKGGIADAIVGSALIVGMSVVFAVPLAVLVAIYVSEYARPRAARFFRLVLDVLNGVPAIVVGIFIYGLLVLGHGQSAIFAALALAILMLPMVSRATQEVLALVPRSLREASLALGVPRWRTVYSIVLPTAIGGILTGVVLAVARVAGETAPHPVHVVVRVEQDHRPTCRTRSHRCRSRSSRTRTRPRRTTRRPAGPLRSS